MNFDTLWRVTERARARGKLPDADVVFVRDVVPRDLASLPAMKLPRAIRHHSGFSISGAPVGTFLRSNLLLAGLKALGGRYGGHPFYEMVEKDLAFGIMRSHFHHGYPKGTHCCVQCTLAVLPVLDSNAIRYFDCAELAVSVRRLVSDGAWRFSKPASPGLRRWAMGIA